MSRAKAKEYNLCSEGDQILKEIEDKLAGLRKGDRKTLTNIKDDMKLQVTVWRRMLNENPEIWKKIDRYANNLIIDEVSMMWTETAQFIMERFPNHEIVFAGDAGYQLPAFKTKEDKGDRTPFSSAKLNIPVIEFNKIFRVTCDRQLAIRLEGRKMIRDYKTHEEFRSIMTDHCFPRDFGIKIYSKPGPVAGMSFSEVEEDCDLEWYRKIVKESFSGNSNSEWQLFAKYMDKEIYDKEPVRATIEELTQFYMSKYKIVTSKEEVAQLYEAFSCENGIYKPKDLIICSTNEACEEWTELLAPLQPVISIQKPLTKNTYKQTTKSCTTPKITTSTIERVKAVEILAAITRREIKLEDIENEIESKLREIEQTKGKEWATRKWKLKNKLNFIKNEDFKEQNTLPNSLSAPLAPLQDSGVIQKYHVKSCSRDLSNGEIVMSIGPPEGVQSQVAHAFTAHSTIGETAAGKVFIDRRRMWEIEHWETIVGRARLAEYIIIIDIPDTPPKR